MDPAKTFPVDSVRHCGDDVESLHRHARSQGRPIVPSNCDGQPQPSPKSGHGCVATHRSATNATPADCGPGRQRLHERICRSVLRHPTPTYAVDAICGDSSPGGRSCQPGDSNAGVDGAASRHVRAPARPARARHRHQRRAGHGCRDGGGKTHARTGRLGHGELFQRWAVRCRR